MAKARWALVLAKYRGLLMTIALAIVAATLIDAIPLQLVLILSVIAIAYILFTER